MSSPKQPRLDPEAQAQLAEDDGDADGDEGGGAGPSDAAVQAASEALEDVQRRLEQVNDEASEAVLAVEQRFNARRRPLYQARSAVVAQIPEFWLQTFLGHPLLAQFLSDTDADVLSFVTEVDVEEFADIKAGFRVSLRLRDNPFFEAGPLVREVRYAPGQPVAVSVQAPAIKPGQEHILAPPGRKGRKRMAAGGESFFAHWLDAGAGASSELADVIKDEIWPNPLRFYAGDGVEEELGGPEQPIMITDDEADGDEEGDEEYEEEDEEDEYGLQYVGEEEGEEGDLLGGQDEVGGEDEGEEGALLEDEGAAAAYQYYDEEEEEEEGSSGDDDEGDEYLEPGLPPAAGEAERYGGFQRQLEGSEEEGASFEEEEEGEEGALEQEGAPGGDELEAGYDEGEEGGAAALFGSGDDEAGGAGAGAGGLFEEAEEEEVYPDDEDEEEGEEGDVPGTLVAGQAVGAASAQQ